ncbi:MAG: hypothetical protein PVG49_16720 [Desulfobacteraceae bacterium]|jgi:hypothetical protein
MRLESLGIDPRTGIHRKNPLTPAESALLKILWGEHEGAENAIPARRLAEKWAGKDVGDALSSRDMRDMRVLINHLVIDHNIPILSQAGSSGGYFMAGSDLEARKFYDTFRRRGMTGLVKASRGRQAALVDMVRQLSFEFDELRDLTAGHARGPMISRMGTPTPIEVVDAFLEKMTRDPEQFADGLRKIGRKYGGVLLPKETVAALRKKAAEFSDLVAGLEV